MSGSYAYCTRAQSISIRSSLLNLYTVTILIFLIYLMELIFQGVPLYD